MSRIGLQEWEWGTWGVERSPNMDLVRIPIRTYSALNQRVHWAVRARRTRVERDAARLLFPGDIMPPCTVSLTRIAPRELDDDAIPGAMKGIRDGIADRLGLKNDRDPRVKWAYGQRRGKPKEYAVQITVTYERNPA